jgi:type II secretory pathway predicted ATPase ExeA/outer membrane protein OmpA-like peptidoglycan-associated protein
VQRHAAENSVPVQLVVHFGLRENPFGVTPDPRFLFHSGTHREALASLINGINCGFGFQVLIAQPGMGKTSLLFNFLERFRTVAHTAFLFQPQREAHELLQSVLYELGTSSEETCLRKLSEQLNQVLYRAAQERKRVIVVVDEAQNLASDMLEALRQLSNFETPYSKLMQIVLAGQPQLAEILATPEQEQLLQRVSSIGRLSPLGLDETQAYINHRLRTAGYRGVDLFTPSAVRSVWNCSKGVPRNINTLCFNAMLLAFAEHAKSIDERMLKEAAGDRDLNRVLAEIYQKEPSAAVLGGNGQAPPPSTPIESNKMPAIRVDRTANLEKKSPLKTAEKDVRSKRKSALDLAPRQPGKARREQSLVLEAPVVPPVAAKKHSEHVSLWPRALALAALTAALALVLVDKFPLPRLGQVEARVPGLSAALQNDSAAASSVPTEAPAAQTNEPSPPRKTADPDSRNPRNLGSDQAAEVVVRKFPTDLSVASETSGNRLELRRIFFNEDSDLIGWQYRPWLQQLADTLAEDPTAIAVLEGHTDSFGPEAYNLDLSSRRAIAVRNALVDELHVSRTRLTAIGTGSAAPVQPNSSAAGRAYNRRVEVRLTHSSQ